jgi:hypothetical protein
VVQDCREFSAVPILYVENERTLGFDGNLRALLRNAHGDYCLFMGNDDVLLPGALAHVRRALDRFPDVGVLLRSYGWFRDDPSRPVQVVRYFPTGRYFPAGPATAVSFFRRVGALSGLVFHRETSLSYDTEQFDGTLFYQLYLAANLLLDRAGLYLPDTTVMCRDTEAPDFGHSEAERLNFTPGRYTPRARLAMFDGMLSIADHVTRCRHEPVYEGVVKDLGNYSYVPLSQVAGEPFLQFAHFYMSLVRRGLWRTPLLHVYFVALALAGPQRLDRCVAYLRRHLGSTPALGGVYCGEAV